MLDECIVTALRKADGDVEVEFEPVDDSERFVLKGNPQAWLKLCDLIKQQCDRSPTRDFPITVHRIGQA